MPGFEKTPNQIRYRVKDPALFKQDSFRTVALKGVPGISSVMGKLKNSDAMTIQSYRFDKSWTMDRAKAWIGKHPASEIAATEQAIKRILNWKGYQLGVEVNDGEDRWGNGKAHVGAYSHIRGYRDIHGDKEALDAYIGPNLDSDRIFKLHQLKDDGSFDENKIIIGCNDEDEARQLYLANMPKEKFGGIVETNLAHIETLRKLSIEVLATEDYQGKQLPKIIRITGPANKVSRNQKNGLHREWTNEGIREGTAVTRALIAAGEQIKVQYSHPCDDPEITGEFSAGYLLDIGELPNDDFYANVKLHHTNPNGLEVATRCYEKDWPDASIRGRVDCDDQENLMGRCATKKGMPLLIDILRPGHAPGIEGFRVSEVLEEYQSDHSPPVATHCEHCDPSQPCEHCANEVPSDLSNTLASYFNKKLKNNHLVGSNYSPGTERFNFNKKRNKTKLKGDFTMASPMPTKPKDKNNLATTVEDGAGAAIVGLPDTISMPVVKWLEMNVDAPWSQVEAELVATGIDDGEIDAIARKWAQMKEQEDAGEMPMEEEEEGYGSAPQERLDERNVPGGESNPINEGATPAREGAAPAGEVAQPKTPPVAPTVNCDHTNPATEALNIRVSKFSHNRGTAMAKSNPVVTKQVALEALGIPASAFDRWSSEIVAKDVKANLGAKLHTAYEEAKVKSGVEFYGYDVKDVAKFPATAIESFLTIATEKCATEAEASGFLKGKLDDLANGRVSVAQEVFQMAHAPNGSLRGVLNPTPGMAVGRNLSAMRPQKEALEAVDRIEQAVLDHYKATNPQLYAKYEANKASYSLAHNQFRDQALEQYGDRMSTYRPSDTAMEDINPIDATSMPNYATVMTAIGGLRYWTPSPMREFFGVLPMDALHLGPMVSNGEGPIGQFVEVLTEVRDQRKVHDAAYYQLPSDAQREIGVRHGYHQYFAFQESTRVRWDSQLEFFLKADPLRSDVPARAIANLRAELDLYDEQRGSTEALRASDAYKSITIGVAETTNMGIVSHRAFNAGGPITTPAGTVILNGIGWVKLRRGQSSITDPLELGPIMRPGVFPFMNRSNLTFEEEFPVTINPIAGIPQHRGQYNPDTRLGEKINDRDAVPTFLLLPDECVIVFLLGSGYTLATGPTFTEYTYVDNFDRFDFSNGFTAIEKQLLANHFVEFIGAMKSTLSERQVPGELVDFLIIPAMANETVATFASHFQGLNQLQFAGIAAQYAGGIQGAASFLRNTRFMSSTEPLYQNRLRGLLGTSKLTVVQELGAPEIGPRLPGGKIDSNGNVGWNSQWSQSITRRHFINTVPRRDPDTGAPLEFGYASLYLDNTSTVVSRLPR